MEGLAIDKAGGNCPLQITGAIDGKPFYFRARYEAWSIGIGGDPIREPEWGIEAPYDNAGWMATERGEEIVRAACTLWRIARS